MLCPSGQCAESAATALTVASAVTPRALGELAELTADRCEAIFHGACRVAERRLDAVQSRLGPLGPAFFLFAFVGAARRTAGGMEGVDRRQMPPLFTIRIVVRLAGAGIDKRAAVLRQVIPLGAERALDLALLQAGERGHFSSDQPEAFFGRASGVADGLPQLMHRRFGARGPCGFVVMRVRPVVARMPGGRIRLTVVFPCVGLSGTRVDKRSAVFRQIIPLAVDFPPPRFVLVLHPQPSRSGADQ